MCARLIKAVVSDGRSFSGVGPAMLCELEDSRDKAFVQACVYGVLRHYYSLSARLRDLLNRPLRDRDADIEALLVSGLYQILHMGVPAHAAVSTSVDAVREMNKSWACSLVNGVLRNALRQTSCDETSEDETLIYDHPQWMIDLFRNDWPHDWESVLRAGNDHGPMTLRVNVKHTTVENYRALLAEAGIGAQSTGVSPVGLRLERPVPVATLPRFAQGWASVQDEAAQLAAPLINPQPGERILDACAAPGGKTGHLLESAGAGFSLLALDNSPSRLESTEENLGRLGLRCALKVADAARVDEWWDGDAFDAILLDAPCTALGVIRRHPDIRLHRRAEDITQLANTQRRLLEALWPLLRTGGRLLYATCSIIDRENDDAIAGLVEKQGDVAVVPVPADWGRRTVYGRQILPGEDEMDGFYYALLSKGASER